MRRLTAKAIALGVMLLMLAAMAALQPARAGTAHDFDFTDIDGTPLPMAQFRGKPVLLVNTASMCGFTYQYDGLQALYDAYRDKGLVVLGVPSNDFGRQEPGSEKEIKEFCEVNFSINFPMTEKQVVSGRGAHPLYQWIGEQLGPARQPRWNFYKYLIDGEGNIVANWSNRTEPMSDEVRQAVERELGG
ncbi:MAG: glutathione peroxidase [Minwuia sp.]|uniref:glutathione peroxidase n=1 Tax=Minwuia sp. TaxID=2493630 RepID=UPI003A84E2D0